MRATSLQCSFDTTSLSAVTKVRWEGCVFLASALHPTSTSMEEQVEKVIRFNACSQVCNAVAPTLLLLADPHYCVIYIYCMQV